MSKRFVAKVWAAVTAVVLLLGVADWLTGYELNFFVFYFVPISAGAWLFGLGGSVILAVMCALAWAWADLQSGHTYSLTVYAVWNTTVRLIAFLAMGWAVSKMREALETERKMAEKLRRALSEVKVLETFLPICTQCKKIRNPDGSWQQLESYIGEHSNTLFSHGYCPECARKAMADAGLTENADGR